MKAFRPKGFGLHYGQRVKARGDGTAWSNANPLWEKYERKEGIALNNGLRCTSHGTVVNNYFMMINIFKDSISFINH